MDEKLADLAQVEIRAKMEGRNMISIYVPDKVKIKEALRKFEAERKKEENQKSEAE
jgi:hypothetical protein